MPDVKETDNGRDSLGKIAIEVSKNGTCALESEGLARAAALDAGWSETRAARRASERHRGASVVSAALTVLKHYSALTDEDRQQQARIAARQDKARTEWEASLKASELERKQRTVQLHQIVSVFFVCANANIPILKC